MFEKLGRFIYRNRKRVLALSILTIVAAGAIGALVFPRLSSGGYSNPKSDSAKADSYVTNVFHIKDPAISIIVDTNGKSLTDPTILSDEATLEKDISSLAKVTKTVSYWSAGNAPQLASTDQHAGYLLVYTTAGDPTTSTDLAAKIQKNYDGQYKSLRLYVGGASTIYNAINSKVKKDLALAEDISIPLTFLFLIFVFGGLVASGMPLVVGISSILGTFFILYLISLFTGVSIFALNLTTGMGLGLGIDYSLLIVNRFREEMHSGKNVEDSIVTTIATAGRTVFFSGVTVFVTLGSLLFFPLVFLRSFGYAGVAVVAMAVLGALIPLPATLAILGTKINAMTVRKSAIRPKSDGRWAKTARFVMKRPVAVVIGCLLILGIFAAPLKDIVFSQVDSRALPASNKAAVADAQGLKRFASQEASPIYVVIPHASENSSTISTYLESISHIDHVVSVGQPTLSDDFAVVDVYENVGSRTNGAQNVIKAIRATKAPTGTLIGGAAADYADTQESIAKTLPISFGWIAISVLILLFLFTGSIILPIKAVLLNIISLSASLGLTTWIFIDNHITWLVGKFTNVGSLDTGMVILTAVVTFALSMDYEVFLLSRIKEEHEKGVGNVESVASGLQRSARIITAAAVLLAVVFATFVTSGVTNIKVLGLGVAFAVLVDATVVRALLVPALMRLFGELNWWAPKALKRFSIKH